MGPCTMSQRVAACIASLLPLSHRIAFVAPSPARVPPLPPPPPDPAADAEGIDASIAGIAKRVVVLLLGLSGLGTVLFYLGLKYAFPDSIY